MRATAHCCSPCIGSNRRREEGCPVGLRFESGENRGMALRARLCYLRAVIGVAGATCALMAGWLAQRRPESADFGDLFWLWAGGVLLFLAAFVPAFSLVALRRRMARRPGRIIEGAALLLLLAAALAVRAYDLEHIPANLGGDEGIWGLEGLAMLDGRMANPFATRWFSFPSMSFLAWGVGMRVFGETVAGLRMLSALIGMAAVLTTFLLARALWGRHVAWSAAVLLAFSHYPLHYSRLAYNNIADAFLITLALWLLVRGARSGRAIHGALCGGVIGLGWYGYFGARLIGLVVALCVLWGWVRVRSFWSRYGCLVLAAATAALVVAGPLLFYYAAYPDMLAARARQVSIFASGWLASEQAVTGRSAVSLLGEQFWKAISAFNYTVDPTFIYRPGVPLLDLVSGLLFVVGLLWTLARLRNPANALLALWFWLAVVTGWVITENPPASQRLVIAAPAAALFASLGLDWLVGWGARLWSGGRLWWLVVRMTVLASIAGANLYFYFAVYTPTRVYGNPTAEIATELARYLERHDDGYEVYFYAPPVMYWDFGTLRFMARDVEGMDVFPSESGETSPLIDATRGARLVFLPHRLGELEAIRARYPNGLETPMFSTADGRLLYVLYEVPPP